MSGRPAIRPDRLQDRLARFAAIGATPKGGVDRQALTQGDRQARALLVDLAGSRGFSVRQDAAANLFLRRPGEDADLPPLLLGSHLDTQPTGGRFDGALGVLAAFEVLEALEDAGVSAPRSVEIAVWTNEEGSRFAPGAMGSQAFASGLLPAEWLDARASDGARLGDELAATIGSLPAPVTSLGFPIAAYLELHIEQGPVLERENTPIGVVTGIQGTLWLAVELEGRAAHAGTTPLDFRQDPMRAAATAMAELYRTVMPTDPDARFTIGRIEVQPGSINSVPESVRFTIDLRHPDAAVLAGLERQVRAACKNASADSACRLSIHRLLDMPPIVFPETMVRLVEESAQRAKLATRRIVSGAFHDAVHLARCAPTAMIFCPCRDGISHNEAEHVEPHFAAAGTTALLEATLSVLARVR
ncbi:Zn-dependent hydrolase [Aureimonas pseudogalii]|uniref:N-carbamoyl-L-amino-acid hydrolase n=1 Tax=Aureimonas pseudogalii TaxID=1744844 RepID=A0A7W6H2L2_9HYPH|nr:Zn-dependent hydrolase [Aureimonas pseudogalii]MBB3996755.1 N-carbamoyl-L-amino-acid hydrolase [Aureimonas pseudogalii]